MNRSANEADRYLMKLQVAFACSQFAWVRRDWKAHQRAAELYRKYTHLWKQAQFRSIGHGANNGRN